MNGGSYDERKFWIHRVSSGTYAWSPPVAAAGTCLEEMKKSRMKRKIFRHIVIIHQLMTPTWIKQLNKTANCISNPPSHSFWPATNYEPLFVTILFPYLDYRPFQLKSTPKMLKMGRRLSKVFQEDKVDRGDFLLNIGKLPSMSKSTVWRLLYIGGETPFPLSLPTDPQTGGGRQQGGG